jgi:hypothetical protein
VEYKGIEYIVVQTATPTGWKWTLCLPEGRTKSGTAFSRFSAIKFAQNAIDKLRKNSTTDRAGLVQSRR